MTNRFRRINYVKITIFGFALSALWQSMHTIVLPLRLLDFAAEGQKNTYLGLLTFTGLLLAIIVQPVAGAISDRSFFRWGRRRPYVVLGTAAALLFLPGIGLAGSLAVLFISYSLLQASTNTAQGPYQAFIPELVPEKRKGTASGVKGLLEVVGGIALIYPLAIFMDRYFKSGEGQWLWLTIGVLGALLLAAMVLTAVTVKESKPEKRGAVPLKSTLFRTFQMDIRGNPDFAWFLLSRLFIFMAFTTIQQFALNFLRDVIGANDPAEATARFSIVAVAGMLVTAYPAGVISDRTGRRPVIIGAGLLGAAGTTAIFLVHDYSVILIAAGVIGLAIGAYNSSSWALATDLVRKGDEARYLGLANVATAGGAALARLIGPIIDLFNAQTANLGYQVMLGACITYFIIGSALVTRIRRRN